MADQPLQRIRLKNDHLTLRGKARTPEGSRLLERIVAESAKLPAAKRPARARPVGSKRAEQSVANAGRIRAESRRMIDQHTTRAGSVVRPPPSSDPPPSSEPSSSELPASSEPSSSGSTDESSGES